MKEDSYKGHIIVKIVNSVMGGFTPHEFLVREVSEAPTTIFATDIDFDCMSEKKMIVL